MQNISFNWIFLQHLIGYKIIINSYPTSLCVEQFDIEIPFLYYDKQIINIEKDKETYELKFKYELYNNDILYICGQSNNYAVLDNCQNNTNEIICTIPKNKLEEILTFSGEQFKIGNMNDDIGLFPFDFVFHININYCNIEKEDLFIGITKTITITI